MHCIYINLRDNVEATKYNMMNRNRDSYKYKYWMHTRSNINLVCDGSMCASIQCNNTDVRGRDTMQRIGDNKEMEGRSKG